MKSENFYIEEQAIKKINELRDQGKRYMVEEMIDYDTCEGVPITYTCISWEE